MKATTVFALGTAADLAILGIGWAWARLFVSAAQRREGLQNLHGSPLSAHYQEMGLTLPMLVTFLGILLCSIPTVVSLASARRFRLMSFYIFFLLALAITWMFGFVSISFDAFD